MIFGLGIAEFFLVAVIGIAGTIFWIWTLIHVITKERDPSTRLAWALAIVFTHLLGALAYWIVRRRFASAIRI